MLTEIITIGNELTEGRITDTNAKWLAGRFTAEGFAVARISSVRDKIEEVTTIISEAAGRSDTVILSGGLGPTSDDVTKASLCKLTGTKLVTDKKVLEHIRKMLKGRGLPMNENNRRQSEIPDGTRAIHNPLGTAPGIWLEYNGRVIVAMPGVPFELEHMTGSEVIPRLKERFGTTGYYSRTVMTSGSFEAMLAEILAGFEKELPPEVNLAYLPSPGVIKLHLSASAGTQNEAREMVDNQVDKLSREIPQYITAYDDEPLEMTVGRLLKESGKSLCTAESCTGGKISSMIVSVSGSSVYYKGGVVAYSNRLKTGLLGIDSAVLEKHGAVSRETAEEMAINACRITEADYSVAVTGIAGPDGGTPGKPVGTVCIAVNSPSGCISEIHRFGDNRERNILRASTAALNMLRKRLLF